MTAQDAIYTELGITAEACCLDDVAPKILAMAIRYREALDYYAKSNLWDGGAKARVALNQ